MAESRIEATDRLRREGTWEAASRFRDEKRREFKAAGLKRAAANDAAWDAMVTEFKPTSPKGQAAAFAIDTAIALLAGRHHQPPMSYCDEVAWVYTHIGDEPLSAEQFPGLGAYSLWIWARSNPAKFYDALWPRAESARSQQFQPIEDPAFIQAVIRFEDHRGAWLEDMAADLEKATHELAAKALSILPGSLQQGAGERADSFGSALYRLSAKRVWVELASRSSD